eukprot:m.16777 g.16777  ORF g.16777 m.16777 type:complete len:90 (+) comp4670_c0_seq2:263-532(+)
MEETFGVKVIDLVIFSDLTNAKWSAIPMQNKITMYIGYDTGTMASTSSVPPKPVNRNPLLQASRVKWLKSPVPIAATTRILGSLFIERQ